MNCIYIEMKKAFLQKKMYIVIILISFLSMKQVQSAIKIGFTALTQKVSGNPQLTSGSAFICWIGADVGSFESTIFFLLMPIFAVLPYGWSLAEELQNGYAAHVICRSGKRRYYSSKLAAAFCSGYFVITMPLVLNFLVVSSFLPCLTAEILYPYGGLLQKSMLYDLYYTYPYIYVCAYIFLDGIYGGIFAVVSTASAIFVKYKYMTILVPFGICIVLEYLEANIITYTGFAYDISPQRFLRAMPVANDHNGLLIFSEGIVLFLSAVLVVAYRGRKDDML